jgi:hypothetical protein
MKCLSARIGEEFHDIDDIRYLLRYLNVTSAAEARAVIEPYYPIERFPRKTLYLLEELLTGHRGPLLRGALPGGRRYVPPCASRVRAALR